MRRLALAWLAIVLLLASGVPAAMAQEAMMPLKVVTRVLPPFVMREGNQYKGFSIDLLEAIAKELGRPIAYTETPNVKELLQAVEYGQGELGIAAISITSERLTRFDFSQPMFESGLRIAVSEQASSGISIGDVWRIFTTGAMPTLLAIVIALILVPAHIVWFAERRRHDRSFPEGYWRGIAHAIWWATGAAAGQQPTSPSSVLGRVLAWIAIPVSIIFVAYFTDAVTAAMTVQHLQGAIQGPSDLPGRRVGTTIGSTASGWLKDNGIKPVETQTIDAALADLEAGKLDAVVFDSPVLQYYANHAGRGRVQVVGTIFRKESYGIAFPNGSTLRTPVSAALLKLRENGTYDLLYEKWFGSDE